LDGLADVDNNGTIAVDSRWLVVGAADSDLPWGLGGLDGGCDGIGDGEKLLSESPAGSIVTVASGRPSTILTWLT
jgi:hypothetical protein